MVEWSAMKCEKCHEREASVHLTQVLDGEACSIHLCMECARAAGLDPSGPMEMNQLLAGTAHLYQELQKEIPQELREAAEAMLRSMGRPDGGEEESAEGEAEGPRCPHCGTTLAKSRKSRRMGCPLCYAAFAGQVREYLDPVTEGKAFGGWAPRRLPEGLRRDMERMRLEEELRAALGREEYERAAGLRDRIAALQADGGD